MPAVNPADVTSLTEGDVATATAVVTVMAKNYTRGNGFDGVPNAEIAAVITTAAARLAANGAQQNGMVMAGVYSKDLRSAFGGWTLGELAVLNRFRKRAMLKSRLRRS
jgi:hypothetical protein